MDRDKARVFQLTREDKRPGTIYVCEKCGKPADAIVIEAADEDYLALARYGGDDGFFGVNIDELMVFPSEFYCNGCNDYET